jgi:type II secretory pathway pseudopilin PulG
MKARTRARINRSKDQGDTLIELLVALVIISIVVAALFNSLIESTSASTEHRSMANLSTVLRSFAESATYAIQSEPLGPGTGPEYTQCATPTSYKVLSNPVPATGPSQTVTTVFATGLHAGSTISQATLKERVASGTPAVFAVPLSAPVTVDAKGDATVPFTVPNGPPPAPYSVTVADSSGAQVTSTGSFQVTSGGAPANISQSLSGYTLQIQSVAWWIQAQNKFVSPPTSCTSDAGTQKLTLRATAQDHTTSTLDVVVSDPGTEAPQITSPSRYTFAAGGFGSFNVTATGNPSPVVTETGSLPTGVSFSPTSGGGLLSGTPTTAGTWNITFTATNGSGPPATQSFTLIVSSAPEEPTIPSPNHAIFTVGTAQSFLVVATGSPTPTVSETGALPGGLSFDPVTNILSGTPNPGTEGIYTFTFTAANGIGNNAVQNFTLTLNLPPTITSASSATFTVGQSGSFTATAVGYPVPTLSESGTLPSGLTFNPATGALSGTPATGSGGVYPISITATSTSGTTIQPFTLTVDEAPTITSPAATTFGVGTAGSFTVTATGYPAPTLSESGTLPAGISFNAASGALSGTPAAGTGGTYRITFTSTNLAGTANQSFTLTVRQSPAITSAATTTFTVGQAGAFTVTATGFPPPTITESGALPTGVTFSSATGKLTGTPAAGSGRSYSITFTATNSLSTTTQSFTLIVDEKPAFTSANAQTFTVGQAGSFTVSASGFPAPALSESGALPTGVSFNAATGVLSGTPGAAAAGTYLISFTATNGIGLPVTQTFTLTVQQSPAITSAASTTFRVGQSGSFTVTTIGYPPPALSVSGVLPNGVTFNPATGVLSGTPTAGTGGSFPITFTATNPAGTATQSFTLTVQEAPTFTSAASASFNAGQSGSFTVTATGSPPPTLTMSGTLPSGVTFNAATGLLSGTPGAGAGGLYPLTFTATNVVSSTPQSFTLTVKQGPAITSPSSTTFVIGQVGSFTVTTSGFPVPTLTESGALPTGVTFNAATGVLSGTPAAGSNVSYPITFTATNTSGTPFNQTFTLNVNQAPVITSATSTTFNVGSSGSFTVTATGVPTPTLSESGALPAGVTFNPVTGVLGGTPTNQANEGGTYPITFKATNAGGMATQSFTLTVNQAPYFTPPNSTTFTWNKANSLQVSAPGYPGSTTFAITAGTLPFNVTFSSSGVLSNDGSVNLPKNQNWTLTITATNGTGSTSEVFTLST